MRTYFNNYNASHETQIAFWDHDYNAEGLRDPAGTSVGHSYAIPNDNTDPVGLQYLWTVPNAARDSIMANHEVIAFKSCYPASAIGSEAMLVQYQAWYLAMRDFFDLHPEKIFVVMSPPPLHRVGTNAAAAARARAFSVWLGSSAYLSGHPNVAYFDLFDQFAQPADGSGSQNMLRYEYETNHAGTDWHPNLLANQTVGPVFAQFLALVAEAGGTGTCCAHAGTCMVTTQAACTGTWAAGGVCTPNPCLQPTGSCCFSNGSCTVTDQTACNSNWTPSGTCDPDLCPSPPDTEGACCASDETCRLTILVDCTPPANWRSEFTVCDPSPCLQPAPTEITSWGQIKNRYR